MSDTDTGPDQNTPKAGDAAEGQPTIRRSEGGRFEKGHSANPAGRPPGSVAEATRIMAEMLNGEIEEVGRTLIAGAKWGKPASLKLVMDPILAPLKKHRPAFALPPVREPEDVPAASAAIADAVAAGLLAPDEVAAFAQALEAQARSLAVAERIRADRRREETAAIGLRTDLRDVAHFAYHVGDCRRIAERVEPDIAPLCQPIEKLGYYAICELLMIPDTPELIRADRAWVAQHPFGADRVRHPLVEALKPFGEAFMEFLDREADYIDRRLDAAWAEEDAAGNATAN